MISFIFVFLCANTELHQVLKMPILIHHYLEHHKESPNLSFANYIQDHYYSNHNHPDNEHHDHKNLPFKTTDCATAHVAFTFNNPNSFSFCYINLSSIKMDSFYNEPIYSSSILKEVFQPPQYS